MKLINGVPAWATNDLTKIASGYATDVPVAYMHPDDLLPLHGKLRNGRFRKLRELIQKNGWEGRPLLGYKTNSGDTKLLTGSHRFAAASDLGIFIPVHVLDLSKHDFSEDCTVCQPYTQYSSYENPCEVISGYRTYSEVYDALKDLKEYKAAELFLIDARIQNNESFVDKPV